MRSYFFSFLIFLMLMPSLACAMPTCAGKSAAQKSQPCADEHSNHHNNDSTKKESGKVNLLLDCMGVDLQTVDAVSVDKPDLKQSPVTFDITADLTSDQFAPHEGLTIRGPPPDNPYLYYSKPSLILTTQRFRV